MLTRKYESMNATTNSITEKISDVAADLSVKFSAASHSIRWVVL